MRTPVTRIEVAVGAALCLGLVAVVAALVLGPAGRRWLRLEAFPVELTLRLPDTAGLTPGSPVRFAGREVGDVSWIALADDAERPVRVTLEIGSGFFERFLAEGRWRFRVDAPPISLPGVPTAVTALRGPGGEAVVAGGEADGLLPPGLLDGLGDPAARVASLLDAADETLASLAAVSADLETLTASVAAGEGAAGRLLVDEAFANRIDAAVAALSTTLVEVDAELLPATTRTLDDTLALVEALYASTEDLTELIAWLQASAEETLPSVTALAGDGAAVTADLAETTRGLPVTARRLDASLLKLQRVLTSVERNPLIRGGLPPTPVPATEAELLPRAVAP